MLLLHNVVIARAFYAHKDESPGRPHWHGKGDFVHLAHVLELLCAATVWHSSQEDEETAFRTFCLSSLRGVCARICVCFV